MKTSPLILITLTLLLAGGAADSGTRSPAFPEARGFGCETVGGRGGQVIYVTNLNDSGPGSLREAVETKGPRMVLFKVSGTIDLEKAIVIREPNITIAGQSAPGDGICLRKNPISIAADEVIVRFIRSRPGDASGKAVDALSIGSGRYILVDHCSASWAVDETLSASTGKGPLDFVTVQWCIISESLNDSVHPKGNHGYGSLIRGLKGSKFSFLNNLYAHHFGRNPRPGNYHSHTEDAEGFLFDFRGNVIYNWGGAHAGYNADKESITRMNYVGNYLVPGQNSKGKFAYQEGCPYAQSFFANNAMDGVVPNDPKSLVRFDNSFPAERIAAYFQPAEFPTSFTISPAPEVAFEQVLAHAGASRPKRDAVDARLVAEVRSREGRHIDSPNDVGGWPELQSAPAPTDTDGDGIPDEWETSHGLNPQDPDDDPSRMRLEQYLNELAEQK